MSSEYDEWLDLVLEIARCKAREQLQNPYFNPDDFDDLFQEISWHLLESMVHYDSGQGERSTFLNCVSRNFTSQLSELRLNLVAHVLAETVDFNDDQIEESDSYSFIAAKVGDIDLKIDIERAYRQLPEDLKMLMPFSCVHTIAELARECGMPFHQMARHVQNLRDHLAEIGLKPSTSAWQEQPLQVTANAALTFKLSATQRLRLLIKRSIQCR